MGYKNGMSRNNIIAAGVVGFFILFGLTLFFAGGKIEADLIQRSKALLQQQGFDWAEIGVDGREMLLTGTAPDQTAGKRALELIRDLAGVRSVKKKFSYPSVNGISNIKAIDSTPAAN
jgi:hypothetical protein